MSEDADEARALIETYRKILVGAHKSWVLFECGTCVILMDPQGDLGEQAKLLLAQWGPVQVGTASADFSVVELEAHPGWVVTCHHPDVLNYVSHEDEDPGASDLLVGMAGRSYRGADAASLRIIHVEDKRAMAT
ncbi:hypothetical protein [Chondromyces crocatus]|uniref:Uncharacterized protein n=1 Tax=Chondromyces crocatus TaxID=52 RepID=A0A0K1EB81_CHOCO|nr:hypothetical protein [Chondromyces crocatus]AKT38115.1 uncharacterized protein CMC5_022570 [Chondromyces crocatus]